jgi:GDP-L-fucose synthase
MHEAKQKGDPSFLIWGTGVPRREFIYSRDLAEACILVMNKYDEAEPINLGMGFDISIAELAGLLKEIIGFKGEISFDPSKPDGMPVKLLDPRKLQALNWKPRTPFRTALGETYQWFLRSEEKQDRGARPEVRGKNTATGKELITADRGPSTADFRRRTADR